MGSVGLSNKTPGGWGFEGFALSLALQLRALHDERRRDGPGFFAGVPAVDVLLENFLLLAYVFDYLFDPKASHLAGDDTPADYSNDVRMGEMRMAQLKLDTRPGECHAADKADDAYGEKQKG